MLFIFCSLSQLNGSPETFSLSSIIIFFFKVPQSRVRSQGKPIICSAMPHSVQLWSSRSRVCSQCFQLVPTFR